MSGGPRIVAVVLALALLSGGCSDGDDPNQPPDWGVVVVDSPEDLLFFFEQSLEAMDTSGYEMRLDDRYVFAFVDGETWPRADDLASTESMLSGEARTNSQGELTKAVTRVDLILTGSESGWIDAEPGDPLAAGLAGVKTATFEAMLILEHPEGTLTAEGTQVFYAAQTGAEWGLIAHAEVAKDGVRSWGSLKLMYR